MHRESLRLDTFEIYFSRTEFINGNYIIKSMKKDVSVTISPSQSIIKVERYLENYVTESYSIYE